MNILLINQTWFAHELRAMGHTVLSCGQSPHLDHQIHSAVIHIDALLQSLPQGFTPDRIVWLDNSCPLSVLGLEDSPIPVLFYSVDTHHHHELHSYLAFGVDHVLIAQKDYMPHFAESGTPTSWMPLWAPEHVEASTDKKHGAVFVGTLNRKLNPDRVTFFESLRSLCPILVTQGSYPEIFPHSEIVVNQTVKGDLNFRVFETMMCGALLLTEKTANGLLELFEDGSHLVTYTARDTQDAAEKINALLGDTRRARAIAQRGREEVLAKHTMFHRALEIDQILRSLRKRPLSPRRHFGSLVNTSVIGILIEPVHKATSCEVAVVSLDAAERALREGAEPSLSESAHLIKACLRHDMLLGGERGAQILLRFADAHPDNYLFSLLRVRSLLNRGKKSEAMAFASKLSSEPAEKVFSTAEHAVSLIME